MSSSEPRGRAPRRTAPARAPEGGHRHGETRVAPEGVAALCAAIKSRAGLSGGLCTHFAASEVLDAPDVSLQIRRFEEALGM